VIVLGDPHSGHVDRPCEASSRGGEGMGIVHFFLEESVRGGCRDLREGHEDDHGPSRIATKQTGEFEPTERY
jgi:hypothetical protein